MELTHVNEQGRARMVDVTEKAVTFRTEKEADTATNPTGGPKVQIYVGNAGTEKFHLPDCASAQNIQEENRVVFLARIQAVLSGYEPCGRCKP